MNYTIKNDILNIEISSFGAELQSIKKNNVEYLWQGDEKSWKNRATNIFPFIGRMQEGKYTYKGKAYEMGSHGLARHTDFIVDKAEDNKIIFKMTSNEDTLKNYPFVFDYFITYEIKDNTLFITSKVVNKDSKPMYFGIGGHPGFITPINRSLNFEDYYLEFDNCFNPNNIRVSQIGLVTHKEAFPLKDNKILNLTHSLFDNDALILDNLSKGVTLKSDKDDKSVYVKYENMTYLGIWHTPKENVDFVCIEPWTSLPGRGGIIEDIEKQDSLICLDASKEYENTWSISIN
ncbi:aldose 1-epimerase family protein [uncultured Tyzzerella sp.]|uniref:aldose 1-epimerase family protein n=1 Tax=uncultured Tyzzerella sp. TaxID=2321398 RepID=UPI002943086C|nr:aldose 1-epimerase family protein [uncultured Tyzzerella sp.]